MKRLLKTALALVAAGGGLILANSTFAAPSNFAAQAALLGSVPVASTNVSAEGAGTTLVCSAPINHTIMADVDGSYFGWVAGTVADNSFPGYNFNPYASSGKLAFFWGSGNAGVATTAPSGKDWLVLQAGDSVGASSTFSNGVGAATNWDAVVDGYLGFRFPCAAGTCYGYAHMTSTGATGLPATLVDYCYDSAGNSATIAGGGPALPSLSKSFTPASVAVNVNSVATITLTNPLSTPATLTAPLTDALPAGLVVVSATTSCGIVVSRPQTPNASVGLPTGVAIPANGSCTLDITVRSATAGSYVNTLAVGALQTDGGNNAEAASATLTVTSTGGTGPVANITPAALSITAATNGTGTATLNIANTGDAALTYSLTESAAAAPGGVAKPVAIAPMAMVTSRDGRASVGGVAPRANPQPSAVVIDEGFDDVATLLSSGGWSTGNNSNPLGASTWAQCGGTGIPPAFDGAPTACALVNFNSTTGTGTISNWLLTPPVTFNSGSTGSFYTRTSTGADFADRLEVRLCTTGACTNFGTGATDVGDFTTVLLTINPNLMSGPDATGVNGYPDVWTQFTLAGLPSTGTGRIAFRYFVTDGGPAGNNSNIIGLDRVVIDNGGGTPPPVGCTNPSDIPWLSETPVSGTVAAGANADVTVTANATGVAAGTYTANVCVATNDPAHALVTVPVALTVTGTATTYTVTPSVGTPSGTISPATPQVVNSGGTTSFTLTPDAGYSIASVGGTCGGTLTGNVYQTAAVTADCTVIANFVLGAAFPAPYCPVTFPSAVEPITRVKFSGIDNVSSATVGGSPALENFLSVTGGDVVAGLTYSMTVEGNTDGGFTTQVKAYIDWNQNGVFDANEGYVIGAIINSTGTDGIQAVADIAVPPTALGGPTRMRVIKKFGTTANPDPCNTTGYGQAEDYTVNVTAETGVPVVTVTPAAFDFTVAQGSTGTDTMVIGNSGTATLTYNITRALAARHAAAMQKFKAAFDPVIRANDARKAALSGEVAMPQAIDLLTASQAFVPTARAILANDPACALTVAGMVAHDHGGVPENGYGWNASAGAVTRIADKFTPTSYPGTFNTVCLSLLTNAGLTSVPVKVVVFADDGAGGAPGTELGSIDVTANSIGAGLVESFQAFDISSMNLSIASGSVYIGVEWDATTITGLYLGADEVSASAGGYSYTTADGAWSPTEVGQTGYKAMYIRAIEGPAGPPGVGCDAPSNVPWLSVNPASGLVAPMSSANVAVTVNPATLDVGNYSALICVNTNDLVTPRIEVPVTLEVTPAPPVDLIFKDGFDGSGGGGANVVTGTINQPVAPTGDGSSFDFALGSFHPYDAGITADDINLYTLGLPAISVYWYGDAVPAAFSTLVGGVVTTPGGTDFTALQSGDSIGPSSPVSASSAGADMSAFEVGGTNYIGVAFYNESTAALNFGYLHVTTAAGGFPIQVLDYGYDNSGAAITIP